MAKQKKIKVGNSLAVTLPISLVREGGWKLGDELVIEHSPTYQLMVIKPKRLAKKTYLSPEFFSWLDEVSLKYADVIKDLAHV